MTVPVPFYIRQNRICRKAQRRPEGSAPAGAFRRPIGPQVRLLGRRWPPYRVVTRKCAIIFTPVWGVGDAAPYCGAGHSIQFIMCSKAKARGTMQASSPTNGFIGSQSPTAGSGDPALQMGWLFIAHFCTLYNVSPHRIVRFHPIIPRICPKGPRPQNAAAGLVC